MPVEPPASPWQFPPADVADEHGVVAVGADLEPGTLLQAYRNGMFPMHVHEGGPLAWWSPDPRGVVPLDGLRVSRSLRRSCRRYEIRIDSAFEAVIDGCADRDRDHGWIHDDMREAYVRMHELGWAHCVEAWDDGGLAGGLYGLSIGGLFAGESMFHLRPDASKVALVALVGLLSSDGLARLLDVQWVTEHLESLGAVGIARATYLSRLGHALEIAPPAAFVS